MEISPRKPAKRAMEPVDEWLQNEGYFRKHAPRDPTCLFRAVSEQVYLTQHYHIRVRKECVNFMAGMKDFLAESVSIPFEDYLEQMACFTEWGGMNEIQAMSLLYKREFIIFIGHKQTYRNVTNNGFKDTIYLCHTPQKQYESIYTRDFVATAAFCQSIVYQTLYEDVFNMSNIESTVHKMLHDRTATFRHDKFFLKGNIEIRDQLTAEIFTRVEKGTDETDDAAIVVKGVPPFPYRVAKALDPNIYRNTDFDIWHEIRREVKNAGWTRHNSHELQIGGKCLVQMNYNDEESDKANNNVYIPPFEKDPNGNNSKLTQKKSKQDPLFFCGHIQEMSKNQGPVLVFIEELGEKRTVPYSALKPLPLRKNKQNNWLPVCKRNVLLDSNTKWKKACGTTSRKIKDSSITDLSNSDKNGNANSTENGKNNFQTTQWTKESVKVEQSIEDYTTEKCNYSLNSSTEVFSPTVLDNTRSPTPDSIKQELNKEFRGNAPSFAIHNSDGSMLTKSPKSSSPINPESNADFNSHPKHRPQKETYYPPYAGNSQVIPDNSNTFCAGPDGNSYPYFPYAPGNFGEPMPNNQMDRMLRSINCTVQKSVDVNGSDLPLSDPFTLRFFYNLGLEYFRVSHNWNYTPNGQSVGFGPWYQGVSQNEEEAANIPNGVQDHSLTHNRVENDNDRRDLSRQSPSPQSPNKCANGMKDIPTQKTENQRGDGDKEPLYSSRKRGKEQIMGNKENQRSNRNNVAPRFKKNSDNRYNNAYQPMQAQQQPQHNINQYQHCGPNSNVPKSPDAKCDNANSQYSNAVPLQMPVPPGAPNSYHAPYMQQNIFTSVPCYSNETEGFGNPYYPPNPGFFPFPWVPHTDVPEGNNMQQFSPHLCPGMDYPQAYPGICAQYLCPPPAPYNIPPQNMQEHWYAVPGQPHYMQFAPMLPVVPETTCNGVGQNNIQGTSS